MTTPTFRHALPPSRLGTRHETLGSYNRSVWKRNGRRPVDRTPPTEFSLVAVLSRDARLRDGDCDDRGRTNGETDGAGRRSDVGILLGRKLRGFGKGFYNCFGGKLERSRGEHDDPARGAARELEEETGIVVGLAAMEEGHVGTLEFTFEDDDVNPAMRAHLYCVFVSLSNDDDDDDAQTQRQRGTSPSSSSSHPENGTGRSRDSGSSITTVHPNQIRGCDEIEPRWFHDIHDIPLDQMFADDSLWLTMLLTHYDCAAAAAGNAPPPKLTFDAWFHFHPGGTETNSIMHRYIRNTATPTSQSGGPDAPTPEKVTFERRLFHALHVNRVHSPSIKEFKENWAMANAVRTFMKDEGRMEHVLDVAGGHGALGALFLLLVPVCREAVVIDPAECASGKRGVRDAWSPFWSDDDDDATERRTTKKELRYRHECLRTGLRDELDRVLKTARRTSVTVVACHACQHLTDETMRIASEYGVNVAAMPCCQKDHDGWWKGPAKSLGLPIGALMDVLAAGKMLGWETGHGAGARYEVKMKLMKESISEQNRIILCRAVARDDDDDGGGGGGTGGGGGRRGRKMELAHAKLTRAYRRAHLPPGDGEGKGLEAYEKTSRPTDASRPGTGWCVPSLLVGLCAGAAFSFLIASQLFRKK